MGVRAVSCEVVREAICASFKEVSCVGLKASTWLSFKADTWVGVSELSWVEERAWSCSGFKAVMWAVLSERSWLGLSNWNCSTVRLATCVGFKPEKVAVEMACNCAGVSCDICLLLMTVKLALLKAAVRVVLAALTGEAVAKVVVEAVGTLFLDLSKASEVRMFNCSSDIAANCSTLNIAN